MALGRIEDRKRKYYLSIAEGKVVHSENGEKTYYASVEGYLENIYKQDRTFKGETVPYWYIDIKGEKGELYSLSLPYKSGTFKSIILAMASEPAIGLTPVKIEPYEKEGFTKVVISSRGHRLDWITKELPPVNTITVSGQTIKDDSERMRYIETLVAQIKNNIGR